MPERRKTSAHIRYDFETTALGRLAAIAEDIELSEIRTHGHPACFADFRDGMLKFVEIELLEARKLEANECQRLDRVAVLTGQIDALK